MTVRLVPLRIGSSRRASLDELVEAGFVAKDEVLNPRTWKASRLVRYRLCDNYARSYLKYIAPAIKRTGYFDALVDVGTVI